MSSIGQALGGIVGGAIGFFVGGPTGALYGAQVGMSVGGLLDPPQVKGPRLEDLSVQTSTYGAFIPRVYGTVALTGNIFWVQNDQLIEQESVSSGKGGPELLTYKYYASFAVGLCEGPIDGVRRIWIGGQLWYDAEPGTIEGIVVSSELTDYFTLYLGTDTQEADPLIQADKGIADTPAYRGMAYIVFNTLPLEKYGNSLMGAQVKVEIATVGTVTYPFDILESSASTGYFSGCYANDRLTIMGYGANYLISHNAEDFVSNVIANYNRTNVVYAMGAYYATRDSGNLIDKSADGTYWDTEVLPFSGEWRSLAFNGTDTLIAFKKNSNEAAVLTLGGAWTGLMLPESSTWQRAAWNGSVFVVTAEGGSNFAVSADGYTWDLVPVTAYQWYGIAVKDGIFCAVSYSGSGGSKCATSPDGYTWTYGEIGSINDYRTVVAGDEYFMAATWNHWYVAFSRDGLNWTEVSLGAGNSGFWNVVASIGDLFYIANYSGSPSVIRVRPAIPYGAPVLLSDIVQAECLKSNILETSDIDVIDLTDDVRGYRVSQQGPLRGGIDPLRKVWPFDVRQHGYKIEFVRRGGSSVVTIPAEDLDAREAGQSPGVSVTDVREMDLVLPQKVQVKYLDVVREYDNNEQSDDRPNTDAVNQVAIELPIVLNAEEAKQTSSMLLDLAWMERYDVAIVLPPTYQQLEPADQITVNADNATYNLRLTSVGYLPDGRLECKAKYDAAATYVQVSVADEGQSSGSVLELTGPTALQLLDIPLMRDIDDTPGFPVAMGGYVSSWPGGTLYRSTDDGASWVSLVSSVSPGAVIGYATNTLPVHGGTVYDFKNTLSVRLNSGTLASVTEAQLFAGSNWFAYGSHGRWEIIAARTATLQGDGSYILQDFMRGQYGTEWATGLHATSDSIVLLNETDLNFTTLNSSSIGTSYTYRPVTIGKTFDSGSNQSFAYAGVNLECLSPVALTGDRNPTSNQWTLYWTRRSRYWGWRDFVDAPLGESDESYEIDIFSDGTYTTLKRTLTSTTETVNYSSANQVTDFGSNQSTLYLKIYQLSAFVGRGYALTQSITR